eukprot:Plantae.Rhodophyta-Purpureofilum_apyrenoidigerum.ctg6482.p1 GENE.Plantae.Rhodophyta-Purpureofilum_apyrenoidigerum.ctg6482~~Plantae.Rhodophyta-Purpureofilum_apyrenoidigerum.ctg6482.p1  ORF type:complete len:387 (+),score=73.57 Plantae.Rhodophyta-Purpureofilum_apyrenoidigerum.ctg6482:95-1255(+)
MQGTVERAKQLFKSKFGANPEAGGAAPGRVNLIGEHTDYCDGFVFPMALEMNTVVLGRKKVDGAQKITLYSEVYNDEVAEFEMSDEKGSEVPSWANYLRGVVAIYGKNGYDIPGFDAVVATDVPVGGGVSSSAAFEMATAMFVEDLCDKPNDPTKRAQWGQQCEHNYVGLMCGIMDQMISSKASKGRALLIDCRSYNCEEVPLADPDVCVLVCNSNVKHSLTGSEYPTRVKQCRAVADAIGVTALRDATMDQLHNVKDKLSETEFRRGRHVITEDERVLRAKDALISKNYELFGKLMAESHESLRDDYEVSIPEIDFLVETALAHKGVYGSRITGGGFGGCTVTLVRTGDAKALEEELAQKFREKFSVDVTIFITKAGEGAQRVGL